MRSNNYLSDPLAEKNPKHVGLRERWHVDHRRSLRSLRGEAQTLRLHRQQGDLHLPAQEEHGCVHGQWTQHRRLSCLLVASGARCEA